MFYDFAITIPAGTTEANPVEQVLELTHGIIHRVEVEFRSGTDFRVACRIYRFEHQIYPTNPDGDFRGDGRAIVFDDHYELLDEPYTLRVEGYSPTASYEHTIYIRIGILSPEVLQPFAGLGGLFRKFFKLVGIGK